MAIPPDGTLSSTEFCLAAAAFSEKWRRFNCSFSQWTWVSSRRRPLISIHEEEGYLSWENVILRNSGKGARCGDDFVDSNECSRVEEDEFIDDAVLMPTDDSKGRHHYDLHIVYSASYMVPVLFCRAYLSDGQLLSLEDIKQDISADSAQLLTESRWMFITQEEHPILNRPWYTLHPCGTSEWMKLLVNHENASNVENYLASWFSVVGMVFGLKLPLEMISRRSSK